jgi:hypothetical protein
VQLCDDANVSGIVSGPNMDELLIASMGRTIATRSFRIRAVACLGASAPEGVVPLGDWSEGELGALPAEATGQAAELITVDLAARTPRLARRTQMQLIAEALAFTTVSQLKPRGTILQTLAVASAFHVVSGIIAPLLVRAEARLLPLFSSSAFTDMIRQAGHQPIMVLPAHLESYLVDAQRALGDHALTFAFVHQGGTATRAAPVARLPVQRLIDVTLLGEQGSYVLARAKDGRRLALPELWRQPGPRLAEGDVPLLEAIISNDATIQLSGYGAARLLSQTIDPPQYLAERQDEQNFELIPSEGVSIAA